MRKSEQINIRLEPELLERWQACMKRIGRRMGSKLLRDMVRIVCNRIEAGERLRMSEVQIELAGETGRTQPAVCEGRRP